MLLGPRDGEPFPHRVPIFGLLESQNIWRAGKTKNEEYWDIATDIVI